MLRKFLQRQMENTAFMAHPDSNPKLFSFSRRAFVFLAGLAAVFRPLPAEAALQEACSGPMGSGHCVATDPYTGIGPCSQGFGCHSGASMEAYGYCFTPSSYCWWNSGAQTLCCDCFSYWEGYCYCAFS
jgi:hypothetical protein